MVATGFDALSSATVHATKRALLDAVGVMLAASGMASEAAPFRRIAIAEGGVGQARLIGGAHRVPAQTAAWANGALGHALDFGDTFDPGAAHPNAALVPALLALAEADPSITGTRFIAAMTIGSDIACRLSLMPIQPLETRGWYPPPLFGLIGATAGCAALLQLTPDETADALALALCQANFPGQIKRGAQSHVRAVREAFAARAAVSAVLLAQQGVRGFPDPLEGESGFFATVAGGGYREAALLNGLGQVFLGDCVSFKPWPSCRGTHGYIEAALALREQPGFALEAITAISADIGPIQVMLVEPAEAKMAPVTSIDAKFSIPFTVATALVHGAVTLDSFSEIARQDARVRAIARKVTPVPRSDWTRANAASGALTIELAGVGRRTVEVEQAAGHPENPVSDADLGEKFVKCAMRAELPLTVEQAAALARHLLDADALPSAAALLE